MANRSMKTPSARIARVFRLGVKELYSLKADPVLVLLIVYAFTFAIYAVSTGAKMEVLNASVAIVDEDQSNLSGRLRDAILAPFFNEPVSIDADQIDAVMDSGQFVFVIEFPPKFEQDALAGRKPSVQISVDATAMSQAGNGASYLQSILLQEAVAALGSGSSQPIDLVVRAKFNPNLVSSWFTALMQVINNVTMLAMILSGAALIREREHGTIEHLLTLPLTPFEIAMAKVWANSLVILLAVGASMAVVIRTVLNVPVAGSVPLFMLGVVVYLFSATALGLYLGTVSRTMAQFALLNILLVMVLQLLSGGSTPVESQPEWMQTLTLALPSRHFVSFSKAILFRGAGFETVWPQFVAVAAIGAVFFAYSLSRFRASIAVSK